MNRKCYVDDTCNCARFEIGGYNYSFSLRPVDSGSKEHLVSMLERQMQKIHDRAVEKTTEDFQKRLQQLIGIKS